MEIYDIVKVQNPEKEGHEINIFVTKEEAQILLQFAFQHLAAIGAVSLVKEKDGINVEKLSEADMGKLN